MQQMIFIADLIACSTCFRHHYAHHQELESIIQVVAACGIWRSSAPHHTDNLKTKAPNTTASNHLYNTLELLMMGVVVPETC
jgi:alkylhydroperoxidase family enzyme